MAGSPNDRRVGVGGVYSVTPPTLTDGQRDDIELDVHGNQKVVLVDSTGATSVSAGAPADGSAATAVGLVVNSEGALFNGATWDRVRSNIDTAALVTAAGATTTQTGADQTNYNGRGVKVVLDMTVVGTGSVTLAIQGKDAASGKYYAILTGAAVVTNVTNVYTIYPGATAVANASVSDVLPRTWRVVVTANNANATTYTVGASVIL